MKNIAIFPSPTKWATPRTEEIRLTTDNAQLILPKKISKITHLWLKGDSATVVGKGKTLVEQHQFSQAFRISDLYQAHYQGELLGSLEEIDLIDYVVEESEWRTLDEITSALLPTHFQERVKNNTFHYKTKDNIIKIAGQYQGLFFDLRPICTTLVNSVLMKQLPLFARVYGFGSDDIGEIEDFDILTGVDVRNWQFRIEYEPLGESVKVEVPKSYPEEYDFTVPFSQQQQLVTSQGLGKYMQAQTNKMGVRMMSVVRLVDSLQDVRPLGSIVREKNAQGGYTGNIWRLTALEKQFNCGYLTLSETWALNWSNSSQYVGVKREFRSWNTPAEILRRNLIYNDYCYLTDDSDFVLEDNALLSSEARQELLRGLLPSYSSKQTECVNFWLYQKQSVAQSDVRDGVIVNGNAFGFGNHLVFSAKMKDNLSAGMQLKTSAEDVNIQTCVDTYYCNDDGKLESAYLSIGSEMTSSFDESMAFYPEYHDNAQYKTNAPDTTNGIVLFKDKLLTIKKDPAEQLGFSYIVHLMASNPDLIIGAGWTANCPLAVQRNANVQVKVWKLTKRLPNNINTMTAFWGVYLPYAVQSNYVEISTANMTITFHSQNDGVGVCLTDENNNILIAYNKNADKVFRVLFTHDRKAIKREFDELHAYEYASTKYVPNKLKYLPEPDTEEIMERAGLRL